MTSMTAPSPFATRDRFPAVSDWEPLLTRLAFAALAFLPVLALAWLLDPRELLGVSVWAKPIKFAVGFAVYLLSLGAFATFIDPAWRKTGAFRWPVIAGSAAIVLEQAIITLQSARGVGSHFNAATAFDATLYAAMGAGSLALLALAPVVALGLARHPGRRPIDDGMRDAIVIGLWMTGVLTLATAGTMAVLGSHRFGAADLRVSHFLATHSMHAVPLIVWALPPFHVLRRQGVLAVAAIYGVAVVAVFVQALSGHPFPVPISWLSHG